MRVLVVEDERRVRAFLARGLTEEGFRVWEAEEAETALTLARQSDVDLILLDWTLPGRSGLDVVRTLRTEGTVTPIIMLTARDQVQDCVEALNAGADDFLVKPCTFDELLARVRAMLRRSTGRTTDVLVYSDLKLDPRTREVERAGLPIRLTNREFGVLQFMMEHPHETLSKDRILEAVWERDLEIFSNIVEVYVRYLRTKVDAPFPRPLIHTVRGEGYRLEVFET